VELYDPNAPELSTVQVENVLCHGGSNGAIEISISGGQEPFNYDWNNDASGDFDDEQNLSNLLSGNYQVSVLDANNCSAVMQVEVTEPAELIVDTLEVGHPTTCIFTNGYISVLTEGGIAPYNFDWDHDGESGDSDGKDLVSLPAKAYNLTVTDANGCSQLMSVLLNDPGAPIITLDATTNIDCKGNSNGSINVTVSGGNSPYSFDWNNDVEGDFDDTEDLTALSDGIYSLIVEDNSNCTASFVGIVESPGKMGLLIQIDTLFCSGEATDIITT